MPDPAEPFDVVLRILVDYARRHALTVYNPKSHEGYLRQAVLRHSHTTGETILILLTQAGELPDREALARQLADEVPGFKGMIWGLNTGLSDVARIEEECWRWGSPELIETVNGLTFTISPQSFFQTNTAAAERLYALAADMAQLGPEDRVLDYCGTGATRCIVRVRPARSSAWNW